MQNPYYQAFCGMEYFQWKIPCDPSELVHFRKRIGEAGMETIFKISVELHGENSLEKEVIIDTTVQFGVMNSNNICVLSIKSGMKKRRFTACMSLRCPASAKAKNIRSMNSVPKRPL